MNEPSGRRTFTVYRFLLHSGSGLFSYCLLQAGIVFDDGNRDHIRIGNDGRGTDKPEFRKCHIVRVNQAGAGGIRGCFRSSIFGFMVVYPMLIVSSQLSVGYLSRYRVQERRGPSSAGRHKRTRENLDVIAFAQFLQSGFQRAAVQAHRIGKHTGCVYARLKARL